MTDPKIVLIRKYRLNQASLLRGDAPVTKVEPIAGGTVQTSPSSMRSIAAVAERMRAEARAEVQRYIAEAQAGIRQAAEAQAANSTAVTARRAALQAAVRR